MVEEILKEIDASLEPLREAKASAETYLAQVQARKEQSAANVLRGEQDLTAANQLLADHGRLMKAQRDERATARAERIANGKEAQPVQRLDDVEGRHLREDVEEAEAALNQLREMDGKQGSELQVAEHAVSSAKDAICQAHIEGIANKMLGYDSLIRQLHAELVSRVPTPIHRRPGRKIAAIVEKALGLIATDLMNTPVNQLGSGALQMQFSPPDRTPKFHGPDSQTRTINVEDISFVDGPKPRGAEAIRKTVVGGPRGI